MVFEYFFLLFQTLSLLLALCSFVLFFFLLFPFESETSNTCPWKNLHCTRVSTPCCQTSRCSSGIWFVLIWVCLLIVKNQINRSCEIAIFFICTFAKMYLCTLSMPGFSVMMVLNCPLFSLWSQLVSSFVFI